MKKKKKSRQETLWIPHDAVASSPGHPFYEELERVLREEEFDSFVESKCSPYYAKKQGRPSIPPGVYFRMLLIGYFERIDSERGICWRCSDSLSLRQFLGLGMEERTPEHSSLSRIRNRLPLEVHESVFGWVLEILASRGMIDGKTLGVDATTLEANAALRSIVRRDTGGKLRIVFEGACAQEWYRRAEPSGHCEVGQEAAKERVEQGVGESERAGCGDHENEERGHGYGAQSRACCGHERGRCGNCRDASRRREG